jgi:hypothetical protein
LEAWSRISRASFEATRMGEGWNGGQGADEGVEILVGNNDHRQRDGQHPTNREKFASPASTNWRIRREILRYKKL